MCSERKNISLAFDCEAKSAPKDISRFGFIPHNTHVNCISIFVDVSAILH